MSEPRGGYTDTYVESVEWQRDKAYARAYAAEARAEKLAAALREKTEEARKVKVAVRAVILRVRALAPRDPDLSWLDEAARALAELGEK